METVLTLEPGTYTLRLPQAGGKPAEMDFVNGQTEVWLSPPPGSYALKLDFADNANPGKTMAESITLPVSVQ